MANYQEFYFLKNWQRFLALSMAVGLISIMRVLFLGQNSSIVILLIGILLVIWFLTSMFKNKKIVINDDFITIENHFFGFRQEHFAKLDTKIYHKTKYGFMVIELQNNHKNLCLLPFFWGNKNGWDLWDYL